ncbi:LLM class flavin-dependent oxidoreductase [Tianweitania sp. BSSL-BM11]|uniref:LLM class flavin-dependent oxidoreductase n=1 Tax=Tianweitania aestuarii TaxID=2814886 RepID=A0ABS5RYV0_9HYPH|nr:LLM class flavin-dependent oxidoreductase [Tianweitania aestuarii]MBS9722223.1 LLM class flavin-dependent oxidoreductase [Tianweitania aestuarii]
MLIGLELGGSFGEAPHWTIESVRSVIERAEAGGVDFVIVPDTIAAPERPSGWPDATILLGYLAASTQRIGLIAATSTGGHQPYNLSRRLASLDQISHGRIGWCVTSDPSAAEDAAFSGAIRLPDGNTPARIVEFTRVVEGLWHGWDADAVVMNKQAGQFIDPTRMHYLDHQGAFFSVRGPLNIMRSPQDRPILMLRAEDLAAIGNLADLADAVLFEGETPPAGKAKQLRMIDAKALASDQRQEDADGIVVRVRSVEEAEAVLQTLPEEAGSKHASTTLRGRLEGVA